MASGRNPATSEAESSTTGNILTSALDMLKIEDAEIRRKAVEFLGSVSVATMNAYGRWITSIKAVADACTTTGHAFSQSELCDFLAVAAKGIDSKRASTKAVNDATFYIYMDVMENYQKADAELRLHYPRIIIDIISILHKGVDTRGEAVGVYGIERYYQERKVSAGQEDPSISYIAKPVRNMRPHASQNATTAALTEGLVDNLSQVTGRAKNDLEQSLSNLQPADIKKVADLSMNYKRLQKYSKLSKPEELKKEVESDLGRNLTDNQLQHALNSIRKTKVYIENTLDGKFLTHGTHGINHVKHNLEYGYQLMGLIEPRRRRTN